ncbi:MAG: hypothetical protein ABSB33_06750 [Tepidisphaeraceae bacterium]
MNVDPLISFLARMSAIHVLIRPATPGAFKSFHVASPHAATIRRTRLITGLIEPSALPSARIAASQASICSDRSLAAYTSPASRISNDTSRSRIAGGIVSTNLASSGGMTLLLPRRLFKSSICPAYLLAIFWSSSNGKRRNMPLKSMNTPYHLADFSFDLRPSASVVV